MMTRKNSHLDRAGRVSRAMRVLLLAAAAVLVLAAVTTVRAADDDREPYAIGLWGHLPYSSLQATVGVPNLIADMNAQKLAFTAHDGDLKSGSSECTDAGYTQAASYFSSLRAPAVFTPGDNDWTDCDRTAGYSSLAQLDKERPLFFSTPYTLGQHRFRQQVQSTPLCLGVSGNVPCVENRRWTVGGVTYATLNIQGSCNNLCDVFSGSGRTRGPQPGRHRVDAGHLRRSTETPLGRDHVHLAGRSWLRRHRRHTRPGARSEDPR